MSHWDDKSADEAKDGRNLPVLASRNVPATTTLDLAPEAWRLAEKIAGTAFVPSALRGKPESVLACMLAGNELGLPLMTSLSKIHVVDGRPGLAAETMRALVLSAGHELWIEEKSNTAVTVGGKRAGSPREQRVTWTLDDARAAGLAAKDNWKKYPRAMLTARAMAELCRDLFPDVIGGLYAVEELADGFDFEQPLEETSEVAPSRKVSSPAARKRATGRAKAAAAEGPEPEAPPLPDDEDDGIEDAVIVDDDTPPPLPDDSPAADAPGRPRVAERAEKLAQAQQIAIRARELDLDRAHVISAVTGGTKTSGKELTEPEGDLVLEALRRLKVGEVRLEEDSDGWILADAPETPNEAPGIDDDELVEDELVEGELVDDETDPDPAADVVESDPGDGQAWRAHIKSKGGTLAGTIRFAAGKAHEMGVPAPGDATALSEADPGLKRLILAWLEAGGK